MANIMLGEETEVKLSQIPLSNGTISDRIEDMSKDILAQVFADLISKPAKSSLQLDETTDVSNLSQLAILVRYVKDDVHALATKTLPPKLAEVLKIVDCVNYIQSSALRHRIFSGLCKEMGSEFEEEEEQAVVHEDNDWGICLVDATPTEPRTDPAGGTSPVTPPGAVGGLAPGIRVAYDRPAADGAEDDRGAVGSSAPPAPDVSLEELMATMKSL
ncbi:hypothetical protein FHG87_021232 [Trinorchestia longiramus]|nr:hypothetical protein FHG87_021232 [Trinorchestia longiramus]